MLAAILNKRAGGAGCRSIPTCRFGLQEVINNCLEKDRELRYQSAADLRADLKRVRRDIESGHALRCDVGQREHARPVGRALVGQPRRRIRVERRCRRR